MSNRDSLGFGDLIPQDVVDIFAQEKHSRRGKKKRSHSLGRALGWLKGKKRKDAGAKGQRLGLGPALDLALDGNPAGHQGGHKGGQRSGRQAHPQAVPKGDDDDKTPVPPLFQENVFIEASRPKYLENLHTEALEGLKMMQQEETNNGVEFQDNESTISAMTVQTDGEGGGFMTDSTIADTTSVVSVQSSVSTRSSRSGLTRQESTFRPLNSGKKSKTRRRHRKTVAGIPQHVQMELGLDRGSWKLTQKLDEKQFYNGETDDSPTTEGLRQVADSQKGAVLRDNTHPLSEDQLEQLSATHAGHRDDMALLQCLGSGLSGEQRPRSVAVPGMTTANSLQAELPSPVMSMSPQAAYMSKIIPNAVLPPSIDVVEISRGRNSRNSVRTVSKSSLLLSSPAPSRASSRASTNKSRHNPPNLSDSSCWSNSESSETLVSDSSTISSSSTPRQRRPQEGDGSAKEDKITSNGKVIIKGDEVKKEGGFVRSLSVMKAKRAPPPPNRSYSLHNKMKRRSRDLAGVVVNSGESSHHSISASGAEKEKNKPGSSPAASRIIDSPGYNADTSSLEESSSSVSFSPVRSQLQTLKVEEAATKDASQEKQEPLQANKLSNTVSPSSGYSSQDGSSAQLLKQPHSSSPKHKRGILAKLQRFFPGSTPAASSPPPPPQPEAPENTKSSGDFNPITSVDNVSPSVRALIELFNIPPPPKIHAPPPPPPEVWAHSKRSFELLLGPPAPDNVYAIIKKNPKDRRQQRKSPPTSTDGLPGERKHKNVTAESVNGAPHVLETKKVQESGVLNDRLAEQNVDLKGNRIDTEKEEKVRVSDLLSGIIMKSVRAGRLAAVKEEEEAKKTGAQATEVKNNMETLPAISLARIPPSPAPPTVHNPPHPPTKQTTEFASGTSVQVVSPELSWPPPPPPIGLSGPDETDFPPPPPPAFGEGGLVMPVQVPSVVKTECVRVTTAAEPQKPNTSQGILPPLNIPPPPSYTAPLPPAKIVSPAVLKKVFPPLPEEVSPPPPPPPPKEVYLLPSKVSPVPLIEVSPPPPKEVSLPPPPIEIPLPPPKVVSMPPPVEVPPPPPVEVSPAPPAPKEVPPPASKEVSPPPPKEVSPAPLPKEITPPPPKEVSPLPPKEVSMPPPVEIPPPPPVEVSPAPPPKEVPPSPPKEVSPPPPEQVSSERPNEVTPRLIQQEEEDSPPDVLSTPVWRSHFKSSTSAVKEVSTLSTEQVSPTSSQENSHHSPEERAPVYKLNPPQSIPPPPPSQPPSSEQEIDPPQKNAPPESETNSILSPPESIPPPPPVKLLPQDHGTPLNTDGAASQETSHSTPTEDSIKPALENCLSTTEKAEEPAPSAPLNVPIPPPLPVQGLPSDKDQPSPASTENQTPELTSVPVVQEEPTPIVTPSILQMVKLRSVNSSPEPPKAQEQPEAEVMMRNQQPSTQVPTSSASSEAPQKPIRKSLILTMPMSPPATVTSQPALPKSQSLVVPSVSSATALSPTKKSPPAMTASPSMNLQEAIRLRTAARSLGPPSRLSLHSPTSPKDLHKSPTSTASFIFSKSNKRVVIETKPAPETKATIQKNLDVSSPTKVVSEEEAAKKEGKMPPPVAKKPKTKGKEIETSEGMEQTAGQEALQENIIDAAEKTNGTAGTVEGGGTPSA